MFDQQFGPPFLSEFSTKGQLQATIDFGFQLAARGVRLAGRRRPTTCATFFAADDYYTDADSNAYAQPTFLGNHDMGRIGYFLQRVDQVGASDAELLARSKLAHALMFFARGQPVVYYGDEQGFTGDGGDKDAREDMFANAVPRYEDNDLIGTDETTSDDNFDPTHPLYQAIRRVRRAATSTTRRCGPARRSTATARTAPASTPSPASTGTSASSTSSPSTTARPAATAQVPTFSPGGAELPPPRPTPDPERTAWPSRRLRAGRRHAERRVPPLGFVIYQAAQPVPPQHRGARRSTSPASSTATPWRSGRHRWDGHDVVDRIEVAAELDADALAEVTFAVREGDGDYVPIGTDDNAPYRVFYDASHLRGQEDDDAVVPRDRQRPVRPPRRRRGRRTSVSSSPSPSGPATPYALIHYNRPAGDYGDHTTGNATTSGASTCGATRIDPAEITDWTEPEAVPR